VVPLAADLACVQARPLLSLTDIVVAVPPAAPSEPISTTSSEPGGGVKLAVVTVIALVVVAAAGAEASSASVPVVRISRAAMLGNRDADDDPYVAVPGVPVTDAAFQLV
jgi:hypothetical protein